MPTGIWLDDDTFRQSAGQMWLQQQHQQLQAQVQAGQNWASQQIQNLQDQARAQVQAIAQPAAPAPTPTPPPAPAPLPDISAAPPPTPPAPPPSPVTAPPPAAPTEPQPEPAPPTPPQAPTPDMLQAGQDWASQQLQNLQAAPAPVATPQPTPAAQPAGGPLPAPAPSVGVPSTASGPPAPIAQPGAPPAGIGQGKDAFVSSLGSVAQQASAQTGIDPNVYLAIAANETGWGRSQTAQQQNNLFSIQGSGANGSRWAGYDSPQAAFDAFNNLISSAPRYAQAWADRANPGQFINDLRNAGYVVDEPGFPAQGWVNQVNSIYSDLKSTAASAAQGAQQAVGNVAQGAQQAVGGAVQAVQGAGAALLQAPSGNRADATLSAPNAQSTQGGPSGQQWLQIAEDQLSKPYIWGSKGGRSDFSQDPAGFDCSGFVSYVMKTGFGVDLPAFTGTAYQQTRALGQGEQPRPGDVVFYNMDSGDPHEQHIALYIGDGKIIQAGGTREDVNIASANQPVGSAPEYRRPTALDNPRGNDLAQNIVGNVAQTATPAPGGGPTYMSAMQPATSGPPTGSTNNLLDPWNLGGVSSALGSKVQDVLGAVQNVGGGLSMSGLQPALGSLGGGLPDITGTLSPPSPGTPLARVVGGTPIGTLSPTDQAQALMQWNQQYEQARTAAIEGLTGNTPLLSGLANVVTDPEQALALAGGGALGEALLPGAGLLPGIGRQALTGALAGGVYGAGQLSASPSDILGNAAAGAALGGAGGGVAALPGALRGLATPEATQAATDLLSAAPETQFSPRGIAIDPLTGQEMVPPGMAPVTNNLTRAMAANPDATQFMRTAGNDFVPIVPQAPMQGSDLLTGLQNMVGSRQQDLADTLQQLTDTVNQANAAQPQSEVQAALQGQVDGLRSRLQDLLTSRQATGGDLTQPPGGAQLGQINAAFARALGGGALGGLTAYQTTDPNDPNRWLKVAGATGAGALAAGPGIDAAMTGQLGRIIQSARVGALAGGIPTLTHIALNTPVQTALKFASDVPADVLTGRVATPFAEAYGGLQGFRAWALDAANQLQQAGPLARSMGATSVLSGPGALETGLTGLVGVHGPLQNLAGSMGRYMDLYRGAANAATDALGRTAQGSGAWRAQVASLLANPTQDMLNSATAAQQRASLTTPLGTTGAAVSRLVQDAPLARFMLPIWQKGYSIATQGVEMTPLGWAGTALDVGRGLAGTGPYAGGNWGGTGAAGAVTPLAQRVRNATIGLGLMYEGYTQAGQTSPEGLPVITGEGPSDPKEQQALRDMGWQPDSTLIGGRYVDNHLLGPVGMALGWGANAYEATHPYGLQAGGVQLVQPSQPGETPGYQRLVATPQGQRAPNTLDVLGDIVAREGRFFNNETFLSSLGSTLNLIGSGVQQGQVPARETANVLSSLIPQGALLSNVASTTDPYTRVAQGATPLEQVQRSLESRLPGARESLPPRLTATGEPMPNPQQGAGLLIPRSNVVNANPILQAMAQAGVTPGAAPPSVPYGPNGEIRLTPDEQQAWATYRGQIVQQGAGSLVNSPRWAQLPPRGQQNALDSVNRAADSAASRMVLRDIVQTPGYQQRVIGTNALAPVYSYAPVTNPQQQLLQQLQQQALLQSLNSGQSGLQSLIAANQAALAYGRAQQSAA